MDEATQKVYNELQDKIGTMTEKLPPAAYYDLLCELSGHLECLQNCYKEEHPEDFE